MMLATLFTSALSPLAIALGYLADSRLGDPAWLYHPVRGLGWAIDQAEKTIRGRVGSEKGLIVAGACATLLLCSLVAAAVFLLISIPVIGFVLAVYFAYSGLALRCLLDEGADVEKLLHDGEIEGARTRLSYLVSRDTSNMDAADMRRSLAETLSENFSDGFVAPLFYLCLLGPVGLWLYKSVNTFDSMWGYRNERFRSLGRFPARLDDALNYVPARLSAFLLVLISGGSKPFATIRTVTKQARRMESPNAGWPMAACAISMGARMGGPTSYFGKVTQKPLMGGSGDWNHALIVQLLHLLRRTGAWCFLVLFMIPLVYWFLNF